MNVTLNNTEIEKAIVAFVGSQGISLVGKSTSVQLIAGRGGNGMSASISIDEDKVQLATLTSLSDTAVPIEIPVQQDLDDVSQDEDDEAMEEPKDTTKLFNKEK